MLRPAAATLSALTLLVGPVSAQPLEGDGIEDLIAGRLVRLSTPYGITLPLNYATDGTVSGDISGFSVASMFTPSETGRWWIDGARMCQQFPTWYDGATHCFTIEQTGEASLNWVRDDGLAGTARVE